VTVNGLLEKQSKVKKAKKIGMVDAIPQGEGTGRVNGRQLHRPKGTVRLLGEELEKRRILSGGRRIIRGGGITA